MGTREDTEEPGPYIGKMEGSIPLREESAWFETCAWFKESSRSKELLVSIRTSEVLDFQAALEGVLHDCRAHYEEREGEERIIPKEKRKSWRKDLITLYDSLLLVVLGAEGDAWGKWINVNEGEKFHLDAKVKQEWDQKFTADSDHMFQSLMIQIYENDDIMLKYYMHNAKFKELLRGYGVILIISMQKHRDDLFHPFLHFMKKKWTAKYCHGPLDEELLDKAKELLGEAKEKFKSDVLHHKNESRRRYKALIYWLLSRSHAPIANGEVGDSKNLEYFGPLQLLFQRLITEDKHTMIETDKDEFKLLGHNLVPKFDGNIKLGTLRLSSVLAIASAANDHVVVKSILESGAEFEKSPECDNEWKASWKKTWASALWNAAYNGHEKVVKELFKRSEFYSEVDQYYADLMQPPLHVAVYKGHKLVVDAFCQAAESTQFKGYISCHDEDDLLHRTPVEVAMKISDQCPDKNKRRIYSRILRSLLRRPEVKQFIAQQKESQVNSINAIMVGATLIAGATYGGWLQPPLGFSTDYQFPEPLPAPPGTFESYMSITGHATVQVFLVFNSLSFFLAIAGIVAGGSCFLEGLGQRNVFSTLRALQSRLIWTTRLFVASVICILVAFASAGIAILPPVKRYQWSMYFTIIFGGGICILTVLVAISVSKSRFKNVSKRFEMFQKCFETFRNTLVSCQNKLIPKGAKCQV